MDEPWIRPPGVAENELLLRIKSVIIAERDAIKKSLIQRLTKEIVPHSEQLNNCNAFTT